MITLICPVLTLSLISIEAHGQPTVILTEDQERYPLGSHLSYLEDPERTWRIQDVASPHLSRQFKRSREDTPSFGFKTSAFWFRWSVINQHSQTREFLLVQDYPMIDRIELFVPRPDGSFSRRVAGDSFPYGLKEIQHESFLFSLKIPPGQTLTFYLRAQTQGALQMPLALWTLEAFWEHEHSAWIYWTVYGLVLFVFFYNLFLYFATRDRTYMLFVFYVACMFAWLFSNAGLAQAYLWPAYPWWANRSIPFALCGCNLFAIATTMWFLNLEQALRRWNSILAFFGLLALVGLVLSLVVPYNSITLFAAFWVAPCSTLIWIVSILCLRKGYRPARYYVAAWSVFFVGVGLVSFTRLGLIPSTQLAESTWIIGSALNVGLISIALADRINLMKKEKEQAQVVSLTIQRQAATSLEEDVQEKTQVLEQKTKELEQAYARLAEQDRLKSSFFANVSHELRTPLTLILTPLRWLLAGKSGQLPDTVLDKLRSMEGNTQRLLRLVNQMLDFSRIEYGGMNVSYERTDIFVMVRRTVEAFNPFARGKGIRLELRGSERLPQIVTDPGNLEKVLSNLISNACKFTDSGGSVVVRLVKDEPWLKVSVKDSGIGIGDGELDKVFERFHQAEESASRRFEGTGIGLALSKELVELAGGKLQVQSELGLGSTFTLYLPLGTDHVPNLSLIRESEARPSDNGRAETAATALAAESGLLRSIRQGDRDRRDRRGRRYRRDQEEGQKGPAEDLPLVVVVEENPDMRTLVADICREDFRVLEAENGQQGLDLIREKRPALVVADVMTPELDGHELLRRVRDEPDAATTPVILLTSDESAGSRLDGLESGADDYLIKPFEPRELRARARNMVRLQEQERRLLSLNAKLQQEVVQQAADLERMHLLRRFLSPQVAQQVLKDEENEQVQTWQQRHHLTVFLLQLRGFEAVLEHAEPEELAALLNGYLSEMVDVAFMHGGTVDKFVRDRVAGFFGAPRSKGDRQDAVRCARMAIQMWERASAACERWREAMGREGPVPTMVLTSGYSTVGYFGSNNRLDYTAVGGPVEDAKELLPQVEPGELCCSHSTWILIQEEMEGQVRGDLIISQRSRSTKVYLLAGPPPWLASVQREWGDVPTEQIWPAAPDAAQDAIQAVDGAGEILPGTRIGTRYEVLGRIGQGGMAKVYRAKDLKLQMDVALKVLHHELQSDEEQLKRLYQEVRLARLIRHNNVARLFDVGEWQGREFVCMECIQGQTLAYRLRGEGALPLGEGQQILEQICEGLAGAHAARIVHRDLKPSNIMLEPAGRVVILDFGVARLLDLARHDRPDTEDQMIGTPYYMAPEQFEGRHADLRTDIYALGAVAYEMFTGRPPFVADKAIALAYQHVRKPPADPLEHRPDLPPRLAAVILRCLEKSPSKRFQSVGEICSLLFRGSK